MHAVESVYLSVCNALTFENLDLESSFFGVWVRLENLYVQFIYQGRRLKVTLTGAKVTRTKQACLCVLFIGSLPLIGRLYCFKWRQDKPFHYFAKLD